MFQLFGTIFAPSAKKWKFSTKMMRILRLRLLDIGRNIIRLLHGGPQYVLYSTGIESSLSSLYDLAGWNLLVKINWGKSGPKVA
jgi:hypothetical protein